MERPVTSKSRGTCRYYNTSRGCYAGAKCKFLHGEEETHTPYDKAKSCRFYQLGYCKRGDQCWFQHELSAGEREAKSESSNDDTCNICLDKPTTYGLLTNCSHVFCQQCIRQWRDPASKTSDVVVSGVIKKCPLCRSSSRFITPSTYFYASGDPRKQETVDKYRESMARVPCKYFEETKSTLLGKPSCPFGSECFYKHENADGTSYVFGNGANLSMGEYRRRRNAGLHRDSRWQNSSTAAEFVQLLGFPMDNIHTALDIIQANFPAFLERIGIGETELRRESETRADPTAYTDLAPLSDDGSDDAEEELEHIGLTAEDVMNGLAVERSLEDTPLVSLEPEINNLRNLLTTDADRVIDQVFVPPPRPRSASPTASANLAATPSSGLPRSSSFTEISTARPPSFSRPASVSTFPAVDDYPSSLLAPPSPSSATINIRSPLIIPTSRFSTVVTSRSRETLVIDLSSEDENEAESESEGAESILLHPSNITGPEDVISPSLPPGTSENHSEDPSSEPDVSRATDDSQPLNDTTSREDDHIFDTVQSPIPCDHDSDPPFVTDGRGRVVWSSTRAGRGATPSESTRGRTAKGRRGAPSSVNTGSSGGFMTDGRGRVVWTGEEAGGKSADETEGRRDADDDHFGRI